jgi:hypothetical protein
LAAEFKVIGRCLPFEPSVENEFLKGHGFIRAADRSIACGLQQAAEKLGPDAVLKGHGFIRANKSIGNGPALAAEGWFCSLPARFRSFFRSLFSP